MIGLLAAALPLLLPLGGCTPAPGVDVIAADGALCDLSQRLMGQDGRVGCLLGPNDDPHQLQLTPAQMGQIRQARLVLINGYRLTPALEKLPNTVKVAELAVPGSPRLAADPHAGANHPAGGHDHGDRDPHVWHDPRQAAAMVMLVSRRLAALDPRAGGRIEARARAMVTSLEALDRWNRRQFATIPAPRTLASSHRAFASLARAYGFQELAVLDAESSSRSLRPQALADAVAELRRQQVRGLFADQWPPARSLQRISDLSGVPLAPAPLRADTGGENLMATLTTNTCLIVDQLGGRCDRAGQQQLRQAWNAIR